MGSKHINKKPTKAQDAQYLGEQAQRLIQELGLTPAHLGETGNLSQNLYNACSERVWAKLRNMDSDNLWRIARQGKGMRHSVDIRTTLADVHDSKIYLDDPYADGVEIVTKVALTTVIARICDFLKAM